MLAMAHVAGGDAMIACFDAKYHYWFWRPYQAIPQADSDGNPETVADPTWLPLGATPNFPEYPSAHACHSTAVVAALDAFFGTDKVPFTLDSRVTNTTRHYDRLQDIVNDVDQARVLVGFHFLSSDLQGLRARAQGRPLRRRPRLPADRLKKGWDTGGGQPQSRLPSPTRDAGPPRTETDALLGGSGATAPPAGYDENACARRLALWTRSWRPGSRPAPARSRRRRASGATERGPGRLFRRRSAWASSGAERLDLHLAEARQSRRGLARSAGLVGGVRSTPARRRRRRSVAHVHG